jgi:hypothetical protein
MEVEGPEEGIDRFCAALAGVPDVIGHQLRGYWVEIRFRPDARLGDPLPAVLSAAKEAGIGILSLSSTKAQTEDAFIQLLEADQADGFSRAYGAGQAGSPRTDRASQS